ncbi:MAG: serine hydrolase [bacterium]
MRLEKYYFVFLVVLMTAFSACDEDTSNIQTPGYSWSTSTPVEQRINPVILDSAFISAQQKGYVDALLVIRNGYLIREEYYNGYDANTPHNIKSVSKGFLSAMTGIALRDGILDSLNEKVMDYFPEYIYEGMDERKYDITIKHLLTMRMGIETEENILEDVMATDNWIKSTIELPLLSAPGERFRYNTLQTHLLSAIFTKASGVSTFLYATTNLTNPMGITIDEWYTDPQGYYRGGWDMFMTPREMAVLGYLYLNKGMLNGIQIIPEEWVETSLTKTWIKDSHQWGVLTDYNYGYLWWIGKINSYEMFWALGYGGQMVITFPDLNLIIVTTADYNVGWDVDQERPILKIISKYILPAVQ